jgi:lipoic acid synthetase
LAPLVRDRAAYHRSLGVLSAAARLGGGRVPVKSGLMVGLGETDDEVVAALRDLRGAGVSLLTIGQYLPPGEGRWPLDRFVPPATFGAWRRLALEMGFAGVASGPLVRSSHQAASLAGF